MANSLMWSTAMRHWCDIRSSNSEFMPVATRLLGIYELTESSTALIDVSRTLWPCVPRADLDTTPPRQFTEGHIWACFAIFEIVLRGSRRKNVMKKMFLIIALNFVFGFAAVSAFAQTPFFQDKTISVILGGPPAGSADLRTRAVVNVLRKHIPGNPTIVMQYMGAGGGRQAANHVYKVAKPDGLTIGSMGAALVANAVLGEPGVQYDIDKFIYLGTPDSAQHYLFISHKDARLTTVEKLRSASMVRIGGQSVGHPVYITGRLFAYM